MHEAAEMFLTCQRVARWSKAVPTRGSRESFTLVTLDREAHFRSLTEQATAAEYHGNVRVLNKLTREAAGQPRIKPIPSVPFNNNTMTMGAAQTNERQYFAKLLQGRVTTLADFRTRSTRCLQRSGSCLQDVRFSEQEVHTAIMRKKSGKSPGFDDIPVELFKAGGDKMVSLLCSLFHGILEQGCMPLWFQGTRMCPLWNGKADPRRCSNHRGIHVSNAIPSIFFEVIKTRVGNKIAKVLPDTQRGRKRGSTYAMHFARSFVQYASGVGYNACLHFADLEKAYDMVVREMAVGCRCTEADLASQLQCLGLDGGHLQWCLDFLRNDGSIMQGAGLEIELVDLVERIYTRSWFCMRESDLPSDQTSVVETQCGGRQGCTFGGIIFRCCTRKPHARSRVVHGVRTCLSLSYLTLLVHRGHAVPTP